MSYGTLLAPARVWPPSSSWGLPACSSITWGQRTPIPRHILGQFSNDKCLPVQVLLPGAAPLA